MFEFGIKFMLNKISELILITPNLKNDLFNFSITL